jgi:hypothetical protein
MKRKSKNKGGNATCGFIKDKLVFGTRKPIQIKKETFCINPSTLEIHKSLLCMMDSDWFVSFLRRKKGGCYDSIMQIQVA